MKLSKVVVGGGCFWCLEAFFQRIPGVQSVVSGYAGGHMENPDYEAVCQGISGHAEVVEITFDNSILSLNELFSYFWIAHDPTTLNRQGNDVGTQYRSVIYPLKDQDLTIAIEARDEAQTHFESAIVTEIKLLDQFWKAEDYHQDYYNNHTSQGYCQFVIAPKLAKLKKIL